MTNTPPLNPAALRGAVDLSVLKNRADQAAAPQGAQGQAQAPEGASQAVVNGTDQNFEQLVELSSQVPVLVELWSPRSEASTQLGPQLIAAVAGLAGKMVLARVNIDENPGLQQAFQARNIPTVAALIGGRPASLFEGLIPEEELGSVLEQVLQFAQQQGVTGSVPVGATGDAAAQSEEPAEQPLPPLHQEAYDAIERRDFDTAIKAYEKALGENPRDADAIAGLAQVRLLSRLDGTTAEALRSNAAADLKDIDAQLAVADLDLSGGHVEDAFLRLLDAFLPADAAGRDAIRKRLLDYFEIVGTSDERVVRARRQLTTLLY
ncbi:tetratricopeptide repeat protein [Humidisolicoccus flavus]|uniref:tetratricopeptide repeat protein n=1 Tax=Humidisolicoccus flavus TaxID=3111414 RepID=UPI003243A314